MMPAVSHTSWHPTKTWLTALNQVTTWYTTLTLLAPTLSAAHHLLDLCSGSFLGYHLPLLHLHQGHLNIDYHIFSNLQNSFYQKLCGSRIFSCSSSTYFDMHQQLAQVHVLGCTELQVPLQTDSAQYVSLERLSSVQLLSHNVIAST